MAASASLGPYKAKATTSCSQTLVSLSCDRISATSAPHKPKCNVVFSANVLVPLTISSVCVSFNSADQFTSPVVHESENQVLRLNPSAAKARSLSVEKVLPPFKLYEPRDADPDWGSLRREAVALAVKVARRCGYPPSRRQLLANRRRHAVALARTLKNLLRNSARFRRGDHGFVPLFYIWTMTNRCNFDCTYCSNHRGDAYPNLWRSGRRRDLSTRQGMRLIDVMRKSSAIYFCGGEPTMRRDLPVLLEHAARRNAFNMINTNGSLIGDLLLKPGWERFLLLMDVVIVSLDALDVDLLARTYKVKTSLARKVLRNLMALRVLQHYVPFKLVANTVVTRETVDEAKAIVDFCADLGLIFSPVSANVDDHPDEALLADPSYQSFVNLVLERARAGQPMIASAGMLERLLRATGFQCMPVVFDHVDHDGRLFWPCKASKNSVLVDVLGHPDVESVHRAAARLVDPAWFHGSGPGKCGGNCAWMQNCVTDVYGRALPAPFSSGIFREIVGLL
ncbi:MAG: hypothetical protein Kow0069_19920 [Promethearchaeota archaeon]